MLLNPGKCARCTKERKNVTSCACRTLRPSKPGMAMCLTSKSNTARTCIPIGPALNMTSKLSAGTSFHERSNRQHTQMPNTEEDGDHLP